MKNEYLEKFLRKYGLLIFFELAIVIAYVIISPKIEEKSGLALVFSAEVLVAILVGVGAIYSWFGSQSDRKYDKTLEMLKDIDEIRKYYKQKSGELKVIEDCRKHIEEVKKQSSYDGTFLRTYLDFIEAKHGSEDEDDQYRESKPSSESISPKVDISSSENTSTKANMENDPGLSLSELKNNISEQYKTDKKYIRYSRNYGASNEYKWSTWFSLSKELIDNSSKDDEFIFFTNVEERYQGVKISSDKLKRLTKNMKVSVEKNGRKTYDFYICEKINGTYYESRHGNDITDVEKIQISV